VDLGGGDSRHLTRLKRKKGLRLKRNPDEPRARFKKVKHAENHAEKGKALVKGETSMGLQLFRQRDKDEQPNWQSDGGKKNRIRLPKSRGEERKAGGQCSRTHQRQIGKTNDLARV